MIGLFVLNAHSLDKKKKKKKKDFLSPEFLNMKGSLQNTQKNEFESKEMENDDNISKSKSKSYFIGAELLRILNLIQNILYLAPTEIKRAFVSYNLSELIIKLYEITLLYHGKLFNELHDYYYQFVLILYHIVM